MRRFCRDFREISPSDPPHVASPIISSTTSECSSSSNNKNCKRHTEIACSLLTEIRTSKKFSLSNSVFSYTLSNALMDHQLDFKATRELAMSAKYLWRSDATCYCANFWNSWKNDPKVWYERLCSLVQSDKGFEHLLLIKLMLEEDYVMSQIAQMSLTCCVRMAQKILGYCEALNSWLAVVVVVRASDQCALMQICSATVSFWEANSRGEVQLQVVASSEFATMILH